MDLLHTSQSSMILSPFPLHTGNSSSGKLTVDLNVNLRDGHGECPLGLALWTDQFDVASRLLEIGADIECMSTDEPGLLYLAIIREKPRACTFLLNNGANFKKRCGIVCCVWCTPDLGVDMNSQVRPVLLLACGM